MQTSSLIFILITCWSHDASGSRCLSVGQHGSGTLKPQVKPGLMVALPMSFSDTWTNKCLFCLSKCWLAFLGLVPESIAQSCRMTLYIQDTTLSTEKQTLGILHASKLTNSVTKSTRSVPHGDKSTIFLPVNITIYVQCVAPLSSHVLQCQCSFLAQAFAYTLPSAWNTLSSLFPGLFPQVTI